MVRVRIDATLPDPAAIAAAAAVIRAGGLVALPTDTLYGLAADPFNREAVMRVFAVKGRSAGQPLPLVAANTEQLAHYLGELPPAAQRLALRFWPGPLTILLPAPESIVTEATGGTGRIGVRVPNHRVAIDLCLACDRPLTATSANVSGGTPAEDADAVVAAFSADEGCIEMLLDSGRTAGGPPSTIVDVSSANARLVRPGAIKWEAIQACLNP